MAKKADRRKFIRDLGLGGLAAGIVPGSLLANDADNEESNARKTFTQFDAAAPKRAYNGSYTGEFLNRLAFPIGGMGAGMFCLEGTGSISHMSVRY